MSAPFFLPLCVRHLTPRIGKRAEQLKLERHLIEKPWGRTNVPTSFGATNGRRIGEIWFEAPNGAHPPLLVKYIFTSEKLSVQVHPNDEQARERGLARGKSECWYILEAEPGATLGLGLRQSMPTAELREAAIGGYLEDLLDWKPVTAGDFFYVPAGTIHAIGAGVTLIEFQQNADVTYRLYDYGRPRELHLEEALAVSVADTYHQDHSSPTSNDDGILVNGPIFTLMRVSSDRELLASLAARRRWVVPLTGYVRAEEETASAGECLLLDAGGDFEFGPATMILCGAEGSI